MPLLRHRPLSFLILLGLLVVAVLATAPVRAADADTTARFHALLDAEWEWVMHEFPEWATDVGDTRYNDRWTDNSFAAIEAREAHNAATLKKLDAIDRAKLSEADQLNYDLFRYNTELYVEEAAFPREYIQVTQRGGVHQNAADVAQVFPRTSVKDYEDFLARLEAVPQTVEDTIALMTKGLEEGITPPKIVLGEVENLIAAQIVVDPTKSPIYTLGFAEMPAHIGEKDAARLRAAAKDIIAREVIPSYQRLRAFWADTYYPKTRDTIGLSELSNGAAWYAFRIREQTTTDMTADEIHELGQSEVARIRAEMESIKESTGFAGTLAEFFQFLRTDPQFFYTERQDLLAGYREICKRIDPELPRLFRTLPRLTYGVVPIPEYSEKTQTTAYYYPGSPEAGRAGNFYANLYDLPSRPRWEMEALTLHEAVPGHHFQIALSQELEDVPNFRKHGGYTAYVEGWGLYSESLGPEVGLYKDPYSKFGQLTYEMWRAIRLVVDTGIHAKGWSRDQAIEFFEANAGKAAHDIRVEVDRYIIWPGQALAYKIGELKIKELRAYAEKELGAAFNIRDFHDRVLLGGAIPLAVLEARVKAWVAATKKGADSGGAAKPPHTVSP